MALRDKHHSRRLQHPDKPSHYEAWLLYQGRLKRRALAAASLLPCSDRPIWKRSHEAEQVLCPIRGLPRDD